MTSMALELGRRCTTTIRCNELMARHTSFRIGGPADLYAEAHTVAELVQLVKAARDLELSWLVVGRGTNILVADRGIRSLVIRNAARTIRVEGEVATAEAGALLSHLARQTTDRGLAGLEFAVDVPGTVGGAVVTNAGAFDDCIADTLQKVDILDREGQLRELAHDDLQLGYRTSHFRTPGGKAEIVLQARFSLHRADGNNLWQRAAYYHRTRLETQPREPSAGSVFKNPPGYAAGALIEQVGLKGIRQGDAIISPKHANFIVNIGHATAQDVLRLIELARERVFQQFGMALELEIELVGEW